MSERGVFAVDRGVFDHERFADEPFTEREAWIWLIGAAAYRAHHQRIGSLRVELKRGQLAHSTRFMAEKWKWSEARVRRFLTRLKGTPPKIDALIDASTDAGITIITISKYASYQTVSLPIDAAKDAPADAAATQQRRREESLETQKEEGGGGARARDPAQIVSRESNLISPEAMAIADDLVVIAGHDPQFLPPGFAGAAMRVQAWLNYGWTREAMIAGARSAMTAKRDGPPSTVSYFEKPIARMVARQSAPIATVEGSTHAKTPRHQPATSWQASRDNWRAAHADLKAGIAAAERALADGGESGDPPIRLIATAGRE